MPIDLMALAEGGPAQLPGRRTSSGKNIFANKELLAKYEQAASPEKPSKEPPRRKSWTPPAKPAVDASDADVRNPWDPPTPKSPARGANDPAKPPPIIAARSGDKIDDEMPVSPRLSDNPFMRRDSKTGLTDVPKPSSPSAKSAPRDLREQAYPVAEEVKGADEAKAKAAEVAAKQRAAEEAKAAAETKATAEAAVEAEAKAATQIQAIAKGNGSRKAEAQRAAAKPEPVATAAASGGDAQPTTAATAAASSPQKQLEQLEAAEATQAREEEADRPATAPTSGATSPKGGAKDKGKEKKLHRLSGSNLFSLLSPRSRRSSRDESEG